MLTMKDDNYKDRVFICNMTASNMRNLLLEFYGCDYKCDIWLTKMQKQEFRLDDYVNTMSPWDHDMLAIFASTSGCASAASPAAEVEDTSGSAAIA